mmetsp:Transcript_18332/g.46930  ORF Transcript_18332/g.46930 Transcript_18332/m.46930 type:complete len:244 (-) Transcript_18332:380-1111(-)
MGGGLPPARQPESLRAHLPGVGREGAQPPVDDDGAVDGVLLCRVQPAPVQVVLRRAVEGRRADAAGGVAAPEGLSRRVCHRGHRRALRRDALARARPRGAPHHPLPSQPARPQGRIPRVQGGHLPRPGGLPRADRAPRAARRQDVRALFGPPRASPDAARRAVRRAGRLLPEGAGGRTAALAARATAAVCLPLPVAQGLLEASLRARALAMPHRPARGRAQPARCPHGPRSRRQRRRRWRRRR